MARTRIRKTQIEHTQIYVCGETEKSYLKRIKSEYRTPSVDIDIISDQGIYDNSKIFKNLKGRVYLVIDKDDKDTSELQRILALCKQNNVHLILNSECLEYWFLSHFIIVPCTYDRKMMFKELEKNLCVSNYTIQVKGSWDTLNKKLDERLTDMTFQRYETALKNANCSDDEISQGDIFKNNFSNINYLIEYLKNKKI